MVGWRVEENLGSKYEPGYPIARVGLPCNGEIFGASASQATLYRTQPTEPNSYVEYRQTFITAHSSYQPNKGVTREI